MPNQLYVDGIVLVDRHSCLINIDDICAFIAKFDGGLPVPNGEEIGSFIGDQLFPFFPYERRIATYDLHPKGQITCAESYVDVAPFTLLTQDMYDAGQITLSSCAQFTLDDVRTLLVEHGSFTAWPVHGQAGTPEILLDPIFDANDWMFLFPKGMDPRDDANSAFRSLRGVSTHLASLLRGLGFTRLFFTGLAYDVCVGLSAIHAAEEGFEVYVIKPGTRAINIPATDTAPGSVETIEAEFIRAGVRVIEDADQLRLAA